jgi:transcription antitermination factor NusG
MSFWSVARFQPQRERLALKCLALYGFETYMPRVREIRTSSQVVGLVGTVRRRRVEVEKPLFPGYCFILIQQQWHGVYSAAGVIRLLMDGDRPARVADAVIDGTREREVGGIVRLPKPPPFRSGDRVRVVRGPFEGHFGLYDGMAPHERIFVLLSLFGASIRTEMAEADVVRRPAVETP